MRIGLCFGFNLVSFRRASQWCALLCLIVVAALSHAEETPRADIRIVIDISGSMKDNDPQNLRVPATELMINMIPEGSEAGVWTFGKFVNMLVPHKVVDEPWRKIGLPKAKKINSIAMFTDIGEAMKRASRDWTLPDPKEKRSLILLTDGMVDVSKKDSQNAIARSEILYEILPILKAADVTINTIALSDNADKELLKKLSLDTDGEFIVAEDADALMKLFLRAFDNAVEQEQVPLKDNRFKIDSSVKEFTALIFRTEDSPPTQLVPPKGKTISKRKPPKNASWYSSDNYDLVTIKNPAAGEWSLIADLDPDNRVTVISDLKLNVEGLPSNIIEGERVTLKVNFLEEGEAIVKPEFLSLLDIRFSQTKDSGENWEGSLSQGKGGKPKIPKNGVYGAKLGRTLTTGVHTFELMVDGKTFERQHSHTLTVHNEAFDFEVVSEGEAEEEEETKSIIATPKDNVKLLRDISMVARVETPSGETSMEAPEALEEGQWSLPLDQNDGPGEYKVTFIIKAESTSGREVELRQGPLTVRLGPPPPPPEPEVEVDLSSELETLDVPAEPVPEGEPAVEPPPETEAEPVEAEAEPVEAEAETIPEDAPMEDMVESEGEAMSEETEGTPMWVWAVVGVVNTLILGGGIIGYRMFIKKKRDEADTDTGEITKSAKNAKKVKENKRAEKAAKKKAEEAEKADKKKPETDPPPKGGDDEEEATVVVAKEAAIDNDDYKLDVDDEDLDLGKAEK